MTEAQRTVSEYATAAEGLVNGIANTVQQLADTATAIRSIDPAAIINTLAEQKTALDDQQNQLVANEDQLTALEEQLTVLAKQMTRQAQRQLWLCILSGLILILSIIAVIR